MTHLLARWAAAAIAVAVAAWLLPGITIQGNGVTVVLVMALVLGLINATVRPILGCLGTPLVISTFGLFLLVVNAFCFWLAAQISARLLDGGFQIDGVLWALLGSLVVSVVGTAVSTLLPGGRR